MNCVPDVRQGQSSFLPTRAPKEEARQGRFGGGYPKVQDDGNLTNRSVQKRMSSPSMRGCDAVIPTPHCSTLAERRGQISGPRALSEGSLGTCLQDVLNKLQLCPVIPSRLQLWITGEPLAAQKTAGHEPLAGIYVAVPSTPASCGEGLIFDQRFGAHPEVYRGNGMRGRPDKSRIWKV